MAVTVVQGKSLVDRVFHRLASGIMNGHYEVDSHLPSERALADSLKVNRQVVREAIRRLSQLGLVQVLHGDGTRVLDFREHGGLDVLALLMEQPSTKNGLEYWVPILELRAALAPDVIRHCAVRAKLSLRRQVLLTAQAMKRAEGKPEELFKLDQRFWDLVHEGANHLVYRLTYNAFKRCGESMGNQRFEWVAAELKNCGYRVSLAEAISTGDAERAERIMRDSMRAMLEKPTRGKSAKRSSPLRASKKAQSSLTAKPPPRKKASTL